MLDPQDEFFDRRLATHLVSLYHQTQEEEEEEYLVSEIIKNCDKILLKNISKLKIIKRLKKKDDILMLPKVFIIIFNFEILRSILMQSFIVKRFSKLILCEITGTLIIVSLFH